MDEVAMRSVNLNYSEARVASATCRAREGRNYFLNAIERQCLRHRIVIGERNRARGHDILPAPFVFGNRSLPFPWPIGTGLASGMRQLHAGDTALLMNEIDDASERFNVPVFPDAQIVRTDTTLRKNSRCLSKHQPCAAHCAAAEMNKMPVIGIPIAARVLA